MTLIWIVAIVLSVVVLWMLWRPMQNNSVLKMESIQQRNIAIANERAHEIDSAYDSGDIETEERDQARQDLEMALADELATSTELKDQFKQVSWPVNLAVLVLVPVLAFATYSTTSNFNPQAKPASSAASSSEAPSFEEIISRLEEAVAANPKDQEGLFLLAQSYSRLGRYADAAGHYAQLIAIAEPDADLLVSFADNSAMANGQIFTKEMADILAQALSLNPGHVSGLWLSGIAAQQLGQPEAALSHWLTLKPMLSANPEASQELAILIEDVSKELGDQRTQEITSEFSSQKTVTENAGPAAGLTVRVTVDPALQSDIQNTDTVFVFARAESGPPMPLAASRQSVTTLPLTVKLDDSMAMLPQMKLSSFEQVLVGARISKSGQAIPQSGDLESDLVASVNTNTDTIELHISKRRE